MPRTTANGIELNYDLTGSGQALVLIHGGWSDRTDWAAVAPELGHSFRVIAYDRRGHGLSTRDVPGTRRDQEDDLAALIEAVAGGPAHVAGTSFGASIALGLASRRPELFRSVVAHEPPLISVAADSTDVQVQLQAIAATIASVSGRVERGDLRGAAEQFVEEIALGPGAWKLMPEREREIMVDSAAAFVQEQRDPAWPNIDLDRLAEVPFPVLISEGDESPSWFWLITGGLRETINDARGHVYRGGGHAPHVTNPGDYVAAVTEFLSRVAERREVEAGVAAS